MPNASNVPKSSGDRVVSKNLQGHVEGVLMSRSQHHGGAAAFAVTSQTQLLGCGRHTADEHIAICTRPVEYGLGNTLLDFP